jgi:hypothetical protein
VVAERVCDIAGLVASTRGLDIHARHSKSLGRAALILVTVTLVRRDKMT